MAGHGVESESFTGGTSTVTYHISHDENAAMTQYVASSALLHGRNGRAGRRRLQMGGFSADYSALFRGREKESRDGEEVTDGRY